MSNCLFSTLFPSTAAGLALEQPEGALDTISTPNSSYCIGGIYGQCSRRGSSASCGCDATSSSQSSWSVPPAVKASPPPSKS